ncbi:MAG: UDP-glucose/GDP-mannose dehydrogenase family protein [Nitrospinota bacterium]|nr:UDP-glucose/GDP-mannose dehydrogenase family protein [Nitrospinota bacterium]MDH5678502.1 UDP-glucose/GDP-mannose dehydrogenase family protein [Nitrospinota bacterium]
MLRICVIGTGYVGLVTGTVFADLGNNVFCADVDAAKVAQLSKGIMPIYEPGLEEIVKRNLTEGRIVFSTEVGECVRKSEIIFICVGTPSKNEGETDLSQVESAAKVIGQNINEYKVVVNKSTVPVGTGNLVRRIITENEKTKVEFDVVSNPEFLREGSAISDALNPDRIVIGAPSKNVAMKLIELYATLGAPMYITDVVSAELIKYASNSFLATKISFINAIADICELAGANITDVARGLGADKRIGRDFLNAGLGYGGSCFPKDISSLEHTARKLGYDFGLLRSVMYINDARAHRLVAKIESHFKNLDGLCFAVLGLSFKANTDDLRDAKSLEILEMLTGKGANVRAYDPVTMEKAKVLFPDVIYADNPYEAAEDADAIILVTEWREFLSLDMERLKKVMKSPVIYDGRNIFDMEKLKGLGFEYHGMGRY